MICLTDERVVRELLQRHGFHFSKKLGQNFLIDETVCPAIAEQGYADADHNILEIGPGIGTLTQQLALRANRVTAIELDQRLFPILKETVGEFDNLKILHGDILKFNVPELLEQEFGNEKPISVCANLPYYITTPILMHLLESNANLDTITVMVQKEVAEKLTAEVGTRESGAITVALNYYGTAELLFEVGRNSFMPAPNVDSAVMQIKVGQRYRNQVVDTTHFFKFVRAGFSQRRKTFVNVVSATMGYDKEMLLTILEELSISPTIRMENLTMEELITINNKIVTTKNE